MKDEKKKIPKDGEISEEQLKNVAGGVAPSVNVKITSVEGESTDDNHGKWIDIIADDPPPKTG